MSKKISLKEIEEKIKKYSESHSLSWEENEYQNEGVNNQTKIINEEGDDCFHFIHDEKNEIYFFKSVHEESESVESIFEIEEDSFNNGINFMNDFFIKLKKILNEKIEIIEEINIDKNIKNPKYEFVLKTKQLSTFELHRKIKKNLIELNPEYQRNYVWNSKTKSLFIESLYLDLPIPPIYVIEKENKVWEVIDGKQRITTIKNFRENKFKLNKIEIEKESLLNKKYDKLSKEDKEKINDASLRFFLLTKKSTPNIKFLLFERLNSGSVKLNNQEIRNAIYYNKDFLKLTNEIIKKFKKNDIYLEKYKFLDKKRFIDKEIISRGLVMMFLSSKIELINNEFKLINNFSQDLKFLKNIDVDYSVKPILATFYENYEGNENYRKDHIEKFVKIIDLISNSYNDFLRKKYHVILNFINNKKMRTNNYFGFDYKKMMTPSFYESLIYVVSYFLNNNDEEIVREKIKNIYNNIFYLWNENKEETIYLFIKGAPGEKAFKERVQKLFTWSN